ncbi:MAG: caspase family protein [Pseudomonadota bacterium]
MTYTLAPAFAWSSALARVVLLIIAAFAGACAAVAQAPTFQVTGVEANDVLNVRSKPTTRSTVVGTLAPGTAGIRLIGQPKKNGRTLWQRIQHGKIVGWVNQRFLQRSEIAARTAATKTDQPTLTTSSKVAAKLKKRVALVIGNGKYRHGVTPLANAGNDGRDIAQSLKRLGFDVIQIIDADLKASKAALRTFSQRAEGAEIALFFFAGHGIQVNGENYLLPTSVNLEQPEDVLLQAVSLSDVMAAFAEAKPALAIVVLDACRNNPATGTLEENARSRGITSIKIGKGLAKRSGLPGMMIVYSTDPDNVAADGIGRNSPFTKAMLTKMTEPEVEVRLMFGAVREAVVKATDGQQTPWMEEAVLGRFYFTPPPEIRTSLFHGRWFAEHWTLEVDAKRVKLQKAFAPETEIFTAAKCGRVFKRTYATLKVDRIRQELGNPRIAEWARRLKDTKTVRVMKIVCHYGANLYYFLLGNDTQMLVARFSEQDWVMFEGFDKDLR